MSKVLTQANKSAKISVLMASTGSLYVPFQYFSSHMDIFFLILELLCGRIGALASELSPKSKICSCSLASSQALTDTVLGYGFQMWPGAWDIFNHVREWHKL